VGNVKAAIGVCCHGSLRSHSFDLEDKVDVKGEALMQARIL